MRLTPEDIFIFSKCPRKYFYIKNQKKEFIQSKFGQDPLLELIMDYAYNYRIKHNKDIEWKYLRRLIIDKSTMPQNRLEKQFRKYIHWYNHAYIDDQRTGIRNLNIEIPFCDNYIYFKVPTIMLDTSNKDAIVFTKKKNENIAELHNDFLIYTYVYFTSLYLGKKIKRVEWLNISGQVISKEVLRVDYPHDIFSKHIENIVWCINKGAKWTSQTQNCQNCYFKSDCKIYN